MTHELLAPLHNVLIWACQSTDPILIEEAARRFRAIDEALVARAEPERSVLEERLFRMLPSDWPLWMETCREMDVVPLMDRARQN